MAVVITRVTPSMLPPTIITAPTSAIARPNAARTIVTSEKRRSCSNASGRAPRRRAERLELLAIVAPGVRDRLARERCDQREDEDGLRDDHRGRREQDAERAERSRTRQQQVDREPGDDGREARAAR